MFKKKGFKIGLVPVLVLAMAMVFGMTAFASITPPDPNRIVLAAGESGDVTVTLSGETISTVEFISGDYSKTKTSASTVCSFHDDTIHVTIGADEEATSTPEADEGGEHALWIKVIGSEGSECGIHVYVTAGSSSANQNTQSAKSEDKDEPKYVPLTPEEKQEIEFDEAYQAGWTFTKSGNTDSFVDFGKEGEKASLWHAGVKLADFALRDANGDSVKMQFLGIKTVDGNKYLNISAFSKAGGLALDELSEEDIAQLKEAGLSGIIIKDKIYNW